MARPHRDSRRFLGDRFLLLEEYSAHKEERRQRPRHKRVPWKCRGHGASSSVSSYRPHRPRCWLAATPRRTPPVRSPRRAAAHLRPAGSGARRGAPAASVAAQGVLAGQFDGRGFTCTYAVASTRATSRSTLAAAVAATAVLGASAHTATAASPGRVWPSCRWLMALWLWRPDAASVAASARPSGVQLGFRAVLTGVLVAGLSTSSRVLGAGLTGVLGSVPLVVAVVAPSTHRDRGSPAARSMLRGTLTVVPGTATFAAVLAVVTLVPLRRSSRLPRRASLWRWSTVPSASGKTGVADAPLGQTAASAHAAIRATNVRLIAALPTRKRRRRRPRLARGGRSRSAWTGPLTSSQSTSGGHVGTHPTWVRRNAVELASRRGCRPCRDGLPAGEGEQVGLDRRPHLIAASVGPIDVRGDHACRGGFHLRMGEASRSPRFCGGRPHQVALGGRCPGSADVLVVHEDVDQGLQIGDECDASPGPGRNRAGCHDLLVS